LRCTVELLSVGNELLLGNTVNTNASWIAAQVTAAGAEVKRVTTIGDNLGEISAAVKESLRRNPTFLITTGGIGPTFDDMTLKGVAKGLGRRIKVNPDAVALISNHYARRFEGRTMKLTAPRLKMASIPTGSVPIPNPVGTAPAVLVPLKRTTIFSLPGVPSEAKAIFQQSILPKIQSKAAGRAYVERWFKLSGIVESALAPIIDGVMNRTPRVYIKSHPRGFENSKPQIELHFSTFASTSAGGIRTLSRAVKDMGGRLAGQRGVSFRLKKQPNID
jgi:molybdenum cofactor synthesis domain-containing protein